MSAEMAAESSVTMASDAGSSPLRLRQSRKRAKLEYTSSNSNDSTTTLDVSVIDVAESTGTDPAESEELDEWPETHFADAQVNI